MTQSGEQSRNLFTGTWKIVSVYAIVLNKGWTLFRRYGPNSFRWEFSEEKTLQFRDGIVAYEGILKEHFKDSPKELTEYSYYPDDKELYIDRSDYAPDGYMNICINDRYRVEHIRKNEYWLYDLEDVKNEPDDYRFRLKIRCSKRDIICLNDEK